MTLAIHPLLLFWKSLASITRINNVRSENIYLNFQGWLLFNYQCSFYLSLSRQPYYYIIVIWLCQQLF